MMKTNNLMLKCFDTGARVPLRARYKLIGDGVMTEVTTTQDGTLVSRIVFHKMSKD
jgi:hypothetical protein